MTGASAFRDYVERWLAGEIPPPPVVVVCSCRVEDAEGHHVAQLSSSCLIRKARA
jgi:hypothetical protein